MATKKKITRKELKKPDEFVSKTTEMYRYALENWKFFVSGLVIVAMILGVGYLWRRHVTQREAEAFTLYHRLQTQIQQKVSASAKICDVWDRLEKTYPGTPAAIYGGLQKASCLLNHGKFKQSEDADQGLLNNAKSPAVVKFMAQLLKGYALEEKKAYKDAEGVFKDLLDNPNNFLKDTVRYHLYICQLRQGKKDAAKETLSKLKIRAGSDFALPVILVKIQKARMGLKE